MADYSRNLYRGLLVPDGDITTIWDAESTVTEAGPRAGIPLTTSKTEAVIEASGHQIDTGASKSLEVLTLKGGYPGPGNGGFGWKQTGDGVSQAYRGWDVPGSIATWENVNYSDLSTSNLSPDIVNVTRKDGTDYMIAIAELQFGTSAIVSIQKRTGDTWAPAGPGIVTPSTQPIFATGKLHPTILVLPTGRLLVFYAVYDQLTVATPTIQVQMAYSDNEGVSWTVGGSYTLPNKLITSTYSIYRMRAAYKDGQILLLVSAKKSTASHEDVIIQYGSDDLGTTFTLVSEFSGTGINNAGGYADVTVVDNIFLVAWIRRGSPYNTVTVQRLGSAYESLNPLNPVVTATTGVDWANDNGTSFTIGELAIASDEDGVAYLFLTKDPQNEGLCVTLRNFEGGALIGGPGSGSGWVGLGQGGTGTAEFSRWWGAAPPGANFPNIQPVNYAAAFHRGRAVIVHRYLNAVSQNPVGQNSLAFFYLGGFSTVSLPGLELFRSDVLRAGLPVTWVPFCTPGDDGTWTRQATGPGSTEQIQAPGELFLQVPVGSTMYYEKLIAEGSGPDLISWTDGIFGRFSFSVNAPSFQQVYTRLWTSLAGGNYGELYLNIQDTKIVVLDRLTGLIKGQRTITTDQKKQVFWAMRGIQTGDTPTGVEVAVWIRDWSTNEDREWDLIYQGPLTIAAGGTTNYVQWGDTETAVVSDQDWFEFNLCYGKQTSGSFYPLVGRQLAQGQSNPSELFPRTYAATPLYVDSNVRAAAVDGPTFEGDSWAVNVRHLQATENVLASVSPSPAKLWRSTTATAGQTIAFRRNPDTEDAWGANDFYAIHFENVNFKRAQLQYKIGGAWVNVISIAFYKEFEFTRSGHTIRPAGDDAGSFYGYYNEFKGLKFEFNPDSQIGVTVATVDRNSEGMAYEGTTAKPTTLFLDPETFDPASVPASGTGHLWFKNMTVLVPKSETPFEGIRLQLCNTGTLPQEGFYSAGNIVPGSVAVFGWDYSRERNVTNTPNVELTTLRDGTRHAYKAGELRRRVRFSWAQGVDVTQLRSEWGGATSPDYVKVAGTGTPAALRVDGELLMWGLLDRIDGPGLPVVYIPKIDFSQAGTPTFDPRQYARGAIYGRTVTPITLETVLGSEEVDEVYRLNSVTIEQEL